MVLNEEDERGAAWEGLDSPLLLKRWHSWSTLAHRHMQSPQMYPVSNHRNWLYLAVTLEFVKEQDDLQSPPYLPLGATLAAQQETHDCLQTAWAQLFILMLCLFFKIDQSNVLWVDC